MPVATALTLLPPSPTQLDFSTPSSDSWSEGSSFQDTLQRAQSSSVDNSSSADGAQSNAADSSTSSTDNTTKSKSSSSTDQATRSKPKKNKDSSDGTSDTKAASTVDTTGDAPVDSADDSGTHDAKDHSRKSKDKPAATEDAGTQQTPLINPAAVVTLTADHAVTPTTATGVGQKKTAAKSSTKVVAADSNAKSSDGAASESAGSTQGKANADAKAVATPVAGKGIDPNTDSTGEPKSTGKGGGHNGKANHAGNGQTQAAAASANDAASAAANAVAASAVVTAGGDAAASSSPTTVHHSPSIDLMNPAIAALGPTAMAVEKADKLAGDGSSTTDATATPQAQFAGDNHNTIVSSVQGQLLPNGGNMQLRLDPPELGVLQVSVQVKNGAMTATFETSNANATHLLSHSLGDLRTALESAGVTVDKIQVQQSAKPDSQNNTNSNGNGDGQSQQSPMDQNPQAKQEQQRRELLQRMWRKLSGGDPLDLTA